MKRKYCKIVVVICLLCMALLSFSIKNDSFALAENIIYEDKVYCEATIEESFRQSIDKWKIYVIIYSTKRKILVETKIGGIKNESKKIFEHGFKRMLGGVDLVFFCRVWGGYRISCQTNQISCYANEYRV